MAKKTVSAAVAVEDDFIFPPEPGEAHTALSEDAKLAKLAELSTPALVTDMDGTESQRLRKKVRDLRLKIDEGYWELSTELHKIWHDTLYIDWGFKSWEEYVTEELQLATRKAQYLVGISSWFGKMGADVQEWVKSLGWSKAKELVNRVDDSNWTEWKIKIADKSVAALIDMLKSEKAKQKGDTTETIEETKRRAFRLYPAQLENVEAAVAKAKSDLSTDSDAHAIDLICTEYLATHQGSSDLEGYLSRIEKIFGISLIAYRKSEDAVIYGQEILDSLPGLDAEASDE